MQKRWNIFNKTKEEEIHLTHKDLNYIRILANKTNATWVATLISKNSESNIGTSLIDSDSRYMLT